MRSIIIINYCFCSKGKPTIRDKLRPSPIELDPFYYWLGLEMNRGQRILKGDSDPIQYGK